MKLSFFKLFLFCMVTIVSFTSCDTLQYYVPEPQEVGWVRDTRAESTYMKSYSKNGILLSVEMKRFSGELSLVLKLENQLKNNLVFHPNILELKLKKSGKIQPIDCFAVDSIIPDFYNKKCSTDIETITLGANKSIFIRYRFKNNLNFVWNSDLMYDNKHFSLEIPFENRGDNQNFLVDLGEY